jgi:putative ABC transport system permease protein
MENIVLTLIGGVLSFVLTFIALRVLEGTALIPDGHFEVNLRVFLFGMLTAVFFGVFSGFYPAWRMARLDPVNALRGGSL